TFAGLSLNDTGSMEKNPAENHVEDRLQPPAPPPPPPQIPPAPVAQSRGKDKKRYSTFAGLALNDREPRTISESAPHAPIPKPSPAPAGAISANPMAAAPSTATGLNYSKVTDSMPKGQIGLGIAGGPRPGTIPDRPVERPAT